MSCSTPPSNALVGKCGMGSFSSHRVVRCSRVCPLKQDILVNMRRTKPIDHPRRSRLSPFPATPMRPHLACVPYRMLCRFCVFFSRFLTTSSLHSLSILAKPQSITPCSCLRPMGSISLAADVCEAVCSSYDRPVNSPYSTIRTDDHAHLVSHSNL